MNGKRVVTVRLVAASLTGSLMMLAGTLGTTLAQDPGESEPAASQGPAIRFTADWEGVQREHLAGATNIVIDPPVKGCPSTLETHSTDQEMTFFSDLADVDALAIEDPAWGDQHVVLLPHGTGTDSLLGEAPTGDVEMAPLLFMAGTRFNTTRTFERPGTGALPQPDKFVDRCASGGGGDGTPPPPDCGDREFLANMVMLNPAPNKLLPVANIDSPDIEELYATCGSSVDMTAGQFVLPGNGEEVDWESQPLPSMDQLSDTSIPKFQISGSANGKQDIPGVLRTNQYSWTLTLCRVVDGQPAC